MGAFYPNALTQQHVPICNAIEAGDFRQALKLVDKRLAKNSDTYLLVSHFHLGAHPMGRRFKTASHVHCPCCYTPPGEATDTGQH